MQFLTFPKGSLDSPTAGAGSDWVATEKIHGAQVVVGVDGGSVSIGKRKAWLRNDEPFFGWQMLRPTLELAGRRVREALGNAGEVWLYGELFGGGYPHPDVAPVPGLVPVQTGVWYAPSLAYAVFDIVHAMPERGPSFLAHERVRELAQANGLLTPPLLGRGRPQELERLPVRFPSLVPALLGLPALADNFAEGYVLKPAQAAAFASRPAVKRKIPEFSEQRFDESSAFDPNAPLSREDLFLVADGLMNPARLASARSKVGTDRHLVAEEAVLDTMIDLHALFPRRMDGLTPKDATELESRLEKKALQTLE
jgi:Rnl2 family RNA ligase